VEWDDGVIFAAVTIVMMMVMIIMMNAFCAAALGKSEDGFFTSASSFSVEGLH